MIETFVKFSRVLYEPLSITVLIAIVLAFYLNWRKWNRLFWIITGAISFMILWRFGIKIISTRYGAILIYPTIILVAYLFYRVTEVFKKIPYLCQIPEKYYPWISRGLLIGIIVPCIIKDFRFNYYADFILKSNKVIKADFQHYSNAVIFDFGGESRRMAYYSGLKVINFDSEGITLQNNIEKQIKIKQFLYDVIYVIVNENPQDQITINLAGSWELISSNFKNNRKKLKFNVYRYTPPTFFKKITEEELLQRKSSEFLVSNGDFEKFTVIKPDNKYLERFKKNELTFFSQEFKLPNSWNIFGTLGFEKGSNAEIEASNKAISGDYSLRMASDKNISCFQASPTIASNHQLEFVIKGKPDSQFAIAMHQYNAQDKYTGFKILYELKIFSNDIYSYQFPIASNDFSPNTTKFRLCFVLHYGEIFIDEVSLKPLQP